MSTDPPSAASSPWRPLFENVRAAVGQRRDEHGVVGSINWLRSAMEAQGANPNVVRNIIYRDKGRIPDKRALLLILDRLWQEAGNGPLELPELQALLSPTAGAEQEVLQLLGRDKRKAYRAMVGGLREGEMPKVLVTGRPGSGKTLLTDYVRQGAMLVDQLELDIVRLEFGSSEFATSLARLAAELGVPSEVMESRLVRIATASAFAVQADAQAEVARVILEAVRNRKSNLLLLLHVSQALATQDALGLVPLRLNTKEVPRVSASEWLWVTLFEPLARQPHVALFVTMTDLPARAMQRLGNFEDPIRLTPPSAAEARRFVRARMPHLGASQQEEIVQRAGRSFEELRTLTLLAQARAPQAAGAQLDQHYIEQLSRLVTDGDAELRNFLAALAVLSPPEFPVFEARRMQRVRDVDRELGPFELSFLDPVPGQPGHYRSFSRHLARALQARLLASDPDAYRRAQQAAANAYLAEATAEPTGEAANRYLHHLFESRDWPALTRWLQAHVVSHSQVRQVWHAAAAELPAGPTFDAVAREVAAHYVKLGAYQHPEAVRAFEAAAASSDRALRAWTLIKRAEGEALAGRFERAEVLLDTAPASDSALLQAESALARASIARWRGDLAEAARLVTGTALGALGRVTDDTSEARLVAAKVKVWEGLIAKDRGDLEAASDLLGLAESDDDLVRARIEFQRGDVHMRLGRLDAALTALDRAVLLAQRSEALPRERTRYLARRGSLLRLRGDLTGSAADFEAARAQLDSEEEPGAETEFWRAKVADESSLTALALGDFEEATYAITHALAGFRDYAVEQGAEVDYRVLRATLNLALAYACRGLALPYRRPFPVTRGNVDSPDLRHARHHIDEVLASLGSGAHRDFLRFQARLLASQFAPTGAEALRHAEEATSVAAFAYQSALALSARAAAHLRTGGAAAALRDVQEAEERLGPATPDESSDAGLRAQLRAQALDVYLHRGDTARAAETLALVLEDGSLLPYHEGVLRAFGEAADDHASGDGWKKHRRLRALLRLDGTGPSTPARLPDALVAAWRARNRVAVA